MKSLAYRFPPLPAKFSNTTPEQYLDRLIDVCKEYEWLIDALAFDIFTHNYWGKFPAEWTEALMSYVDEAGDDRCACAVLELTSKEADYSRWPTSLKAYLETIRDLPLPRDVLNEKENERPNISKYLLGGMSNKKVHEVEVMAHLIHTIAQEGGISSVIDLGSGQGYLSRALAFDYGLEVLAVDMSEVQTKGAIRFDKKALKESSSSSSSSSFSKAAAFEKNLKHVTEKITPENITDILARYTTVPEDEQRQKQQQTHDDKRWLVTGLHTCGDLAPMILDLFAKSRQVACVVNVGCCYNALTEKGFPMSSYLQRQQKTESAFYLNSTSRVLSCHSPSRWIEEGQQCIAAFDNYFFRALFQEMLVNKGLSDINDPPRLGRIKQNKDFVTFVKAALRRMKLPPETITEEEAKSHLLEAKRKSQDKQFIILWTLRGMLAPILESIILMDRWLYLNETIQQNSRDHVHEENSQRGPWMYPLFDLSISPRNVVLVASK